MLFLERQSYIVGLLAGTVDIFAPGLYDQVGDVPAIELEIKPGRRVNSYYVHFDPLGNVPSTSPQIVSGSIVFEGRIIGIQIDGGAYGLGKLVPGDVSNQQFRLPGTAYNNTTATGLDLPGVPTATRDYIEILPDERTVNFRLNVTGTVMDDFRVLTEVPEPATLLMIGCGLLAVASLARRFRTI